MRIVGERIVGDQREAVLHVGVTPAAGEPSWERLDTYTIEADLVVVRVNESVAATIPNWTVRGTCAVDLCCM